MKERIGTTLFDLRYAYESGQPLAFHADYNNRTRTLSYFSTGKPVRISFSGTPVHGAVTFTGSRKEVERRLRLSDDMKQVYKRINTDRHVNGSIIRYRGLRLTLNDPWETTVCFIISQFNNVKRIRLIVRNLIDKYGEEIRDSDGRVIGRAFPTSERMIGATTKELFSLGTGFRAKYLQHAAEYCTNNLDLYNLPAHKYAKLKESLLEIHGVGDKVADCIALMGYGNLNAFPIDVHIKRSMERLYFKGEKQKMKDIHEAASEFWGEYRGYANQYLFHDARMR